MLIEIIGRRRSLVTRNLWPALPPVYAARLTSIRQCDGQNLQNEPTFFRNVEGKHRNIRSGIFSAINVFRYFRV